MQVDRLCSALADLDEADLALVARRATHVLVGRLEAPSVSTIPTVVRRRLLPEAQEQLGRAEGIQQRLAEARPPGPAAANGGGR